jgi:hypothetical protein
MVFDREKVEMNTKLREIEKLVINYSQIDGSHHKLWVFDQIMRIIKEDKYDEFVKWYEYTDEHGKIINEKIYDWDKGIAP